MKIASNPILALTLAALALPACNSPKSTSSDTAKTKSSASADDTGSAASISTAAAGTKTGSSSSSSIDLNTYARAKFSCVATLETYQVACNLADGSGRNLDIAAGITQAWSLTLDSKAVTPKITNQTESGKTTFLLDVTGNVDHQIQLALSSGEVNLKFTATMPSDVIQLDASGNRLYNASFATDILNGASDIVAAPVLVSDGTITRDKFNTCVDDTRYAQIQALKAQSNVSFNFSLTGAAAIVSMQMANVCGLTNPLKIQLSGPADFKPFVIVIPPVPGTYQILPNIAMPIGSYTGTIQAGAGAAIDDFVFDKLQIMALTSSGASDPVTTTPAK